MRRDSAARHFAVVILTVACAVLAVLGLQGAGSLDGLENDTVDARFALRGAQPTGDLAVVAIDEDTFSELEDATWPFSRAVHARVVDQLRRAGAELIVYDVQFTEPSGDDAADLELYDAFGRAPGSLLATAESADDGSTMVLGGDEALAAIEARAGASTLPADDVGTVRHYEARNGRLPTLGVLAAKRLGRPLPAGAFDGDGAWIDFRGGPGTIPTLSFSDVHAGRAELDVLRGKTVVVGASAATLQDLHPTPLGGARPMSGPELQANVIWTAAHGNPLRSASAWTAWALPVALGLAIPLVALLIGPLALLLVAPTAGGLYLLGAQLAFERGTIVAVAAPMLAMGLSTAATIVVAYIAGVRERRRIAEYNERLEREVRERTTELRETQLEVVQRLAYAAEARDGETGAHVDRMSHLCERVALVLGWDASAAEALRHASAMHDIGKIAISDAVLLKPGRLDRAERAAMQEHTLRGAAVLEGSRMPLLQMAERIARTHHERWDGTGYPSGLAGEDIPIEGRIAAVCDVFDALVTERPYKRAWTAREALTEIARQRDRHFDPAVVDAFMSFERDLLAEAPPVVGVLAPADPAPAAPPSPHGAPVQ